MKWFVIVGLLGGLSLNSSCGIAEDVPTEAARSELLASSQQGCPSGDVCIYPSAGWNGGHPEPGGAFLRYACYPLHSQIGVHRVLNNQTGGAKVLFCKGTNCTGCFTGLNANVYSDIDLTPVNSILLEK